MKDLETTIKIEHTIGRGVRNSYHRLLKLNFVSPCWKYKMSAGDCCLDLEVQNVS
ncbi:hypothetical protein BgiMline_015859, partial [Biomphalaria glabrata]